MQMDLVKLRLVGRLRKLLRWRRDRLRALTAWLEPMSNDFDRAPLERAALAARIDATARHPDTVGEVAVYSTYCGTLRNLTLDRKNRARDYPHYFVSNNRSVLKMARALGWKPIFLDLPLSGNPIESAHQAKVAKALPHLFPDLRQHRFLLYTDDKKSVKYDKYPAIVERLRDSGAAMALQESSHIKDNVLWEFTDSLHQPRYMQQAHQMLNYTLEQLEAGKSLQARHLFNTAFIARDMTHPRVNAMNETWYDDILSCGIDCQLAFDFLAQGWGGDVLALPPAPRKKYLGQKIEANAPPGSVGL
ncbi:hypothetical protein [Sagittula salina]|uniref:Uncharacterized protein n=1 Tax=Sagittula salina TaxID=2820268 RepID=A0A940S072_9RHOB|nr:hypothetical protein [Sagittula salina]MBP0482748.1 hypothetical protein [Sagittula salina]